MKSVEIIKIVFIFYTILSNCYGDERDSARSFYKSINNHLLRKLDPTYIVNYRVPNQLIPDNEILIDPTLNENWEDNLLVEDDAGVMNSMKTSLQRWNEIEEYAYYWGLESTGLYNTPSTESKKKYLEKYFIKYIDKRISGEVKHAKKGSSWAKVGRVQKTLKPTTKVSLSKKWNVQMKLRAKVLQGYGTIEVRNPWVEFYTNIFFAGRASIYMKKSFKNIKVKTEVNYNVNEGRWIASLSRPLTSTISVRLSSTVEKGLPNFVGDNASHLLQFNYLKRF